MEPNNADGYAASRDSLISHLASNLLMLMNRRLKIKRSRRETEEFLNQHCRLIEQLQVKQQQRWQKPIARGRDNPT